MFTPLVLRLFSRGLQLSIYDARHWQSVEESLATALRIWKEDYVTVGTRKAFVMTQREGPGCDSRRGLA